MPVSREEYQKLIDREMRRYGRGGTGGESARDKAVRAANVAAGYGSSTALKYPAKVGGGGRTLSRDGDDTKAKAGPAGASGGGKGPGGGKGGSKLPGISRNPYDTQRGSPDYGPPGRLSDENAGPPRRDFGPPGRLSDENAGPAPLFPMAVVLPQTGMVRTEGPARGMPGGQYGPQVEPQGRPPGGLRTPGVFSLPGRPEDFDQGSEGLPYERSADRVIMPLGGPGREGAPFAPYADQDPGFIQNMLNGLGQGSQRMGRIIAPWLQGEMFR